MCGIFGFAVGSGSGLSSAALETAVERLFHLSEARGREASGIALANSQQIVVHKTALPGSRMIRTADYRQALAAAIPGAIEPPLGIIGHSRLVTDGCQGLDANNQPVGRDGLVMVHNGIVVNVDALWQRFPQLQRTADVDTEVMAALMGHYLQGGSSIPEACQQIFQAIEGESSIAILFAEYDTLLLATNTGSLFTGVRADGSALLFASEAYIVRQLMTGNQALPGFQGGNLQQVKAGEGLLINLKTLERQPFSLSAPLTQPSENGAARLIASRRLEIRAERQAERLKALRRCTRCILPETMPFISFDADGVCNYCRHYQPTTLKPEAELEEILSRYRSKDGSPDCLVAFSGGRDSSHGLHLLKTRYNMNPIAYTYDWGMVTGLGRRNQARICGKLGIEHIWVSADIRAKRENIRRNVEAWMKRPDLGIIPLFMAGDKQFFYYANQTMKQTGLELMVFCTNRLEKTDFKTGFCGIPPYTEDSDHPHSLGSSGKFGLLGYYAQQFLKNPAYFNASVPDTLFAYFSYYLMKKDFTYFFDYYHWDEQEVNDTLINEYHWELAKDTTTTWRIGDGTAPFYNYVYHTVAGFTEHDTFRSNQVREGILTRDEALAMVEEENRPRMESLREYTQMIRVDFDEFLRVVHAMPTRY